MGIHISVRKIVEKTKEKSLHGDYTYYKTEEQEWFDSLRYYGDRDFVLENEFIYMDEEEGYNELARPKDFEKCRRWVKEKGKDLTVSNKDRLMEMLNKLEQDNSLVLFWSF